MLDLKCVRFGDWALIDKAPSNDDLLKLFVNGTPAQFTLFIEWGHYENVEVFVDGLIRCHEGLIVTGRITSNGAKFPVVCDVRKERYNLTGVLYVKSAITSLGFGIDLRELTNEEVEEMRRKTGNPSWGCGD